jgi:glycosyltransferase involved in cell wall biosynthesis/SAM-dependent methyltransferase
MRIGVDYRFISSGFLTVNRGMGRYTQQQLRETLKHDTQNEYILFCMPNADRSLILQSIRSAPNVAVATIKVSEDGSQFDPAHLSWAKVLRLSEEYQRWIYAQQVDVYHATTPFDWHDIVMHRFDACPMVATFYDVIPLLFQEQYLPTPAARDIYKLTLNFCMSAERLLAISESARRDASTFLGVPASRIDLAYPVADPCFRILPAEATRSGLDSLRRRRITVPDRFLLTVTHLHYSKNLNTLLAGYARVPIAIRQVLPLLIACQLSEAEKQHISAMATGLGISESVFVTGLVGEDELVALYNAAVGLIHPSRYEGFGLPVLEALQCGTPVITTSVASLPEVAGEAAILVDPNDPRAFADAIEQLYHDPGLRAEMRVRGLAQAQKFSAEQLGSRTLESYQNATRKAEPVIDRPGLAVWTPLPPQPSGIADYSAELLSELTSSYEIEVFVDDGYFPSWKVMDRWAVHHHSAFERRLAQRTFDAILYQLGNSHFHTYMYGPLQKWPGFTLVHDLVWSNVLYSELVGAGRIEEFVRELESQEGRPARLQFESIMHMHDPEKHAALHPFLRQHYMLKRVMESSLAIGVQSDLERHDLIERYRQPNVFTIHMGVSDPCGGKTPPDRVLPRESLGAAPDAWLIGVFGVAHPIKRIDQCVRAFARLWATHPQAQLWIVGQYIDPEYQQQIEALVNSLGLSQHVHMTGRVDETIFTQWLLACDVVVNLRFPSMKQISAIILRALSAGKPLVISDIPEWEFVPDDCCFKIVPDEQEVDALARSLLCLADQPGLQEAMSARARLYYEQNYTVVHMAARYRDVIAQVTGRKAAPPAPVESDAPRMRPLNKPYEVEDFADSDMVATIRDVYQHESPGLSAGYPHGTGNRQAWSTAMAIRTLRQVGHLDRTAVVLVIGAADHPLAYYLTRHVRQVFAVDRYLDAGHLEALIRPEGRGTYPAEVDRLVVQHMDGRLLRYPDNTFDAVVICRTVGRLGSPDEVACALYEVGRVLKPGGAVTLTVDYVLSGPPGGSGWDAAHLLFPRPLLGHAVIEASGLVPMDDLRTEPSATTLATPRYLDLNVREIEARTISSQQFVWVVRGYALTLLHLALQKTEPYPAEKNEWARPSPLLRQTLALQSSASASLMTKTFESTRQTVMAPNPVSFSTSTPIMNANSSHSIERVHFLFNRWNLTRLKAWHNRTLRRLPGPIAYLVRLFARVFYLGRIHEYQAEFDGEFLAHVHEVSRQLDGAQSTLNDFQARMQQMTTEIYAMQQTTAGLLDLSAQVADLAAQGITMNAGIQATQQQVERLSTRENEVARLELRLTETSAALQTMQQQLDAIAQLTARQRDLDAALQSIQSRLDRLPALGAQVDQLDARQTGLDTALQSMQTSLDRLPALGAQVDQLGARLTSMDTAAQIRLSEFDRSVSESRIRDDQLSEQLRLAISRIRLLSQIIDAGSTGSSASPDTVSSAEVVGILQTLEHYLPALATCVSVDLSLQAGTEAALVAGAAYLGDRMSSKGPVYRAPNDLWYHMDLTAEWNRPVLFESAVARLAPGGYYVLVTWPEHQPPAVDARLRYVVDVAIKLDTQRELHAYVWQAQPQTNA